MAKEKSDFFLVEYWGHFTKGNKDFWWMPAALLGDVCAVPLLLASDAVYQSYIHVLTPIGKAIGKALGVIPDGIIEFMAKSTVFMVPAAILGGMGYVGFSFVKGRSIVNDASYIKDSIASICEAVIAPKVFAGTVGGLVAGIVIGSKFS